MSQKQLPDHERRAFPRVSYRAYATLITTRENWPAHLVDLSFHGALIAILYRNDIRTGEEIQLTIELDSEKPIYMYGHIAHHSGHMLGIECRATGIDQQQRLRQLVHQDPATDYMNRSLDHMLQDYQRREPDENA